MNLTALIEKYSERIKQLESDRTECINNDDIKHAEMINANLNDTEEFRRDLFNLIKTPHA